MTVLDLPSDVEHARLLADAPWRRIAVVGDSVAEGVREATRGWPDRGWVDWIAAALPEADVLNLGRRSLLAREVREQQLAAALAFDPDLVLVSAGGNDMFRRDFDEHALVAELAAIVEPLRRTGADVLMHEYLDFVGAGLVAPEHAAAVDAKMRGHARAVRRVAGAQRAMLVEALDRPADSRLWSSDRIHLNAEGHARFAVDAIHVLARHLASRRQVRAA
jgi:lysophospholipase L1-like esterase